jgi:ATP-dependent DNA ligase
MAASPRPTTTALSLWTAMKGGLLGGTLGVSPRSELEEALVAQIAFMEWTSDGRLRHPSFLGVRFDKPAREVVREEP